MAKINCLLHQPNVQNHLEQVIELYGLRLSTTGRKPSLENIWRELRQDGVEVDVATVAHLYGNVFDVTNGLYSSQAELDRASGETQRRVVEKMAAGVRRNEIGRLSPVSSAIAHITGLLQHDTQALPTVQKMMQDRLKKVALRLLKQKGMLSQLGAAPRNLSMDQILSEVLTIDGGRNVFDTTQSGVQLFLKNADELWRGFQQEMDEVANDALANNAYEAQLIRDAADAFQAHAYDLMLSAAEVNRVLMDTLKAAGFSKSITTGGVTREVVDWKGVLERNPDFAGEMTRVLGAKGYTPSEIAKVVPYFEREYTALRAEKLARVAAQKLAARAKKGSTQGAATHTPVPVDEILKEALSAQLQLGLPDLPISWGEIQRTLSDALKKEGWVRLQKSVRGDQLVADASHLSVHGDIKGLVMDAFQNSGFTQGELLAIADAVDAAWRARLGARPSVDGVRRGIVDRLGRLAALGAFPGMQDRALMDLLGVEGATRESMQRVRDVMIANSTMRKKAFADWAPTDWMTYERAIQTFMERGQEGVDWKLNVVNKVSLAKQWMDLWLLLNVGNLIENVSSSFAAMITQTASNLPAVMTALRHFDFKGAARAFSMGNSLSAYGAAWGDVLAGGAREGVDTTSVFSQQVNLADRASFEDAKSVGDHVYASMAMIDRLFLSSFDAGAKSFLTKNLETFAVIRALRAQGLTAQEANEVVNQAFHANRAELMQVAEEMIRAQQAAGINALWTAAKTQRLYNQLVLSNLETGGQVMQDILKAVVPLKAAGVHLPKGLLLALRKAASGTAARAVGHKSDSALGDMIDRKVLGNNEKTHLSQQWHKNMGRMIVGSVFRFRSGGIKWLMLNMYKSSGLALLVAVGDMLVTGKGGLLSAKKLQARFAELEKVAAEKNGQDMQSAYNEFAKNYESALAARQRIATAVVQPLFSYLAWNTAIRPALSSLLDFICTDEGGDCLQKKMEYIMEKGWGAWVAKVMPAMVQVYLMNLVEHDPRRGNYYNYSPDKKAPKELEGYYTGSLNPVDWEAYVMGARYLYNNMGQDPIFGGIIETIADRDKAPAAVGKFVGKTLNPLGPLRAMESNERYFNALEGISNAKSKAEYNRTKATGFWDGFWQQAVNDQLYEKIRDKD